MNIFHKLNLRKRKRELQSLLEEVANLLIVTPEINERTLYSLKGSNDTSLSYASSYKKLLNKCKKFKDKNKKEVEESVIFSLFLIIGALQTGEYKKALIDIKELFPLIEKIDNYFITEARYIHYIASIVMASIIDYEIFHHIETGLEEDKKIFNEIHKKIERADDLLKIFDKKYESLGIEKIKEAKLRILKNQKEMFTQLCNLESQINEVILSDIFLSVMSELEDNLNFIEKEMLNNKFIIESEEKNGVYYPVDYLSNITYLCLQNQRVKIAYYKRDDEYLNKLLLQVFEQTNYSNWEDTAMVIKNGNKEEILSKIQSTNELKSFNEYINSLNFIKITDDNGKTMLSVNNKI